MPDTSPESRDQSLGTFLRNFAITGLVFLGGSCGGSIAANRLADGSTIAGLAGFTAIPLGLILAFSVTQFVAVVMALVSGAKSAVKTRSFSALFLTDPPSWVLLSIPVVTTSYAALCGLFVGWASDTYGAGAMAGAFAVGGLLAGMVFYAQARTGWFDDQL